MPLDEFSHYFSESKISSKQRKKLDDSQFGIPSLRKYPLTDEKHVLQAVRFFKKAPEEHKPELARNIVKRAKELNMDWEKWDVLKPYLDKPVKEAYAKELHSTPEADNICAYLCKSVKYDNASPKTWRLKSPDEVTDHNKGNCHDTAWYVFKNLDAYAKHKVGKGILFFIEYKEGKKEGGQTHSVCYEKIPGGICIIECSWQGMTGTFPYNDIEEYISVVKKNWEFTGDNDKLFATEIKNTSRIHPGMTLSEYVFVAMKNKEIIAEAYDPTDDHTSGTSDFDNEDDDPDDCYCESDNNPSETEAFYKRWKEKEGVAALKQAKEIVKKIAKKVKEDEKPPCGNQNCQLCTWCVEAQFRDIDALPRPVYSPRDPALAIKGETIVKDPKRISIQTGYDDMLDYLMEPVANVARFYCHVNWNNSTGGHEFIILKIGKQNFYIVDAQAGIVEPLSDTSNYFNDINFANSFICRLDNHDFNKELFEKYNDPKSLVPWDGRLDIPYMLEHGMLSEEEAEQYWKEHPDEAPKDRHFLSFEELYELPTGIGLRPANEKDLPTILEWTLQTMNSVYRTKQKIIDMINKENKENIDTIKIITDGNKDIGMYQAYPIDEGEWWYLAEIYLIPNYRGKGIGSTLIKNDIDSHDKLVLRVDPDNVRAIKLYESLGFVVTEKEENSWIMRLDKTKKGEIFESGAFAKYGKDVDLTVARGPIQESFIMEGLFGPSKLKMERVIDAAIKLPSDYRHNLFSYVSGKSMVTMYDGKKINSDTTVIHWLTTQEIYNEINQMKIQTNLSQIKIAALSPSGNLIIYNNDDIIYMKKSNDSSKGSPIGTWTDIVNIMLAKEETKIRIDDESIDQFMKNYNINNDAISDFIAIYSDKEFVKKLREFNRLCMSADAVHHYSSDLKKFSKRFFSDSGIDDEKNGRVVYFELPDNLYTDSQGSDVGIAFAGVSNPDEYLSISCKDGKVYYLSCGDPKNLVSNSFVDFLKSFEDTFFTEYLDNRVSKPIQEGAWQDIKNGVNPYSKNLVFHISAAGHYDGQVFKPRVPEYLEKSDENDTHFEDTDNPRVCFSPSIEGALNAIIVNLGSVNQMRQLKDLYVYVPEKPLSEYKHRTTKQLVKEKKVFDANLTKEIWIEEPVRLKEYGVIRIDQVNDYAVKDTVPNARGKSAQRYTYSFRWHWVIKPKVLKNRPYDYSPESVSRLIVNDLWKFKYGLIKDGRLTNNASESDYDKYWKLSSPETFDEAGGGNCADFTEWTAGYFDAYGVKCKKYFMDFGNNFHTFVVVEYDKKQSDINKSDNKEKRYALIDGAIRYISKNTRINKDCPSLNACFDFLLEAIQKVDPSAKLKGVYDFTNEKIDYGTPMKEYINWIKSHGKKVNTDKPIKEEYTMSDFERDPSVLQMILEAEAEEAEEKEEKDDNDDEKGDAIESETEISIEGEAEIGSDVGDVQNEYNPEEVERLNKLINSEMSAVSEYFNAAKESKEPNLMRLFSDIGDEERFHLEQLIYAKSTITGEEYEPQDPKVKKEYQELIDMGLDEETAMTTAIDKVQLMPKEATEDMSEDEAADFEEGFRLISATSLQTAVMLEAAIDTSDVMVQLSENSTAFLEQMIIMEEVDNLNTRQGQKDLGSKNPIVILIKAFVAIYGAIINLARKARLAFQKIHLRDKRKWAWIKKHGIGAIFAKGVSFYFFSEKKNMYDVGEPMKYISLIHSMNAAIIKSCNITTISPNKYDINGYINKLVNTAKGTNREIHIEPLAARNTEDGIRLLQGVSLTKTKVVLTQENTPILEEQFFGYTTRNYAMIEKEGENTKNIKLSINVYNQMSILLDALAALGAETKLVMEALQNQEGTQGTTYDKMPAVWKNAIRAIGVMEKSVSKFNAAVAADVSEMLNVNNGLKEAMETADTSGDTSAVTSHKNDVDQQKKANADASKKAAEGSDINTTYRKMK